MNRILYDVGTSRFSSEVTKCSDYCPTRVLRSVDQKLLSVKKTRTKIGDSSFAVAASVLWERATMSNKEN